MDLQTLNDLLADLQHWCAAVRLAEMHYEAERGDNFDI